MTKNNSSHKRAMQPGFLETMTIDDVRAFRPEVVVIPLGSTEPHGPHLPYVTDTLDVRYFSEEAVKKANANNARVLLLPTLPYGNNVNFKKFPFACRIKVRTLMLVILDLVEFVLEEGVRKIVFVNGHGGNTVTIQAALREVFDKFQDDVFVCMTSIGPRTEKTYQRLFQDHSQHAGDFETSLVMHVQGDLVNYDTLREQPMRDSLMSFLNQGHAYWVRPWHQYLPSSSGGRPDHSSAEKGKEFLDESTEHFSEFLTELSNTPWTPGFPYASEK